LRWLSLAQVSIWLPLLMLGSAFWLLNFSQADIAAPPALVQISMKTGFGVSFLMCSGLLFGFFREKFTLASGRKNSCAV